jgi:hypothetical protein
MDPGGMRITSQKGPEDGQQVDEVNWDGVLSPQERQRILSRIHSAFAVVGARIPDIEIIDGERVLLRELVFDYLGKTSTTAEELKKVDRLAEGLDRKVRELEGRLHEDQLTERAAVDLMKETLGVLRALQHLRSQKDPKKAHLARRAVLGRVDDERRWLEFISKVKL